MFPSRGLAAAAAGLLLVLTGCTSFSDTVDADSAATATATTPAEPAAAEITWSDCTGQIRPLVEGRPGSERDLTFECGSTEVPISYAEPDGATLPLFLVRAVWAGQADRIGSLLVNPGGPGVSAADAAIGQALTLPEDVLRRFDVVGFDPRGVALSTPVECVPAGLKERLLTSEPRPVTDEQLDTVLGLADEVAEGCAQEYGDALGAFNTTDTARDMDLLRQGLGDEQLTYLGYSYGTALGSTYAELFPDRVRALVLDAAVDPDTDPVAEAEERASAQEAGFDAFAGWCTQLMAGCPLGENPRGYVEDLLAQATEAPIPSAAEGETRQATPGVVLTAVQAALYSTSAWPQLAQSLAAAAQGDSRGLFSLADNLYGRLRDGTWSNLVDANIAISCTDTPADAAVDEERARQLAVEWRERYPFFGPGAATGLYSCTPWEADRTPLPERDAEGSAPILVVGTAGDPVTPLPGAVDMAQELDSGVLLTWEGQGHTAYPKTDCVTAAVNAYLVDLAVPQEGLTCPA